MYTDLLIHFFSHKDSYEHLHKPHKFRTRKNLQAVLAVFRGLKRCPGPVGMNMYRLSAHELCKSLLVFFDDGKHWPNGLHSQIPACQDWALKTAKALVKLVS